MAELEVILVDESGGLDTMTYSLTELAPPTRGRTPTRFRSQGQCHNGQHAEVYTGYISRQGLPDLKVVCKLAEGPSLHDLDKEAKLYATKFKALQGTVVPRFYGFYVGTWRDLGGKDNLIGCIILEAFGMCNLERCGKFLDCGIKLRWNILQALMKLHDAGVKHNRLKECHVLISSNLQDVRIVDFYWAIAHKCPPSAAIKKIFVYAPQEADFGCKELYHHALHMQIWTPHNFNHFGHRYSVIDYPDVDSLVHAVGQNCHDKTDEEVRARIEPFLRNYYEVFAERFEYIGDPRESLPEPKAPEVMQRRRRQRT